HTSCLSDWSSDVCSSDLRESVLGLSAATPESRRAAGGLPRGLAPGAESDSVRLGVSLALSNPGPLLRPPQGVFRDLSDQCPQDRSEERRVGKVCRTQFWR